MFIYSYITLTRTVHLLLVDPSVMRPEDMAEMCIYTAAKEGQEKYWR